MRILTRILCVLALLGVLVGQTCAEAAPRDGTGVAGDDNGEFTGVTRWKERSPGTKGRVLDRSANPKTKSQTAPKEPNCEGDEVFACLVNVRQAKGWAQRVLDPNAVARELMVRLQLPDPTPQIGPDPEVNEWKMVAVGYPLWLWTRGPATVTTTARAYGVSFTLQATWLSTTFDMGDGHRVTCSSTAVYDRSVRPGAESPSCGYRYETSSLPRGNYSVTATTNWRITWRALGQSGSLPGSYSGTRSLPVGELNALVVR